LKAGPPGWLEVGLGAGDAGLVADLQMLGLRAATPVLHDCVARLEDRVLVYWPAFPEAPGGGPDDVPLSGPGGRPLGVLRPDGSLSVTRTGEQRTADPARKLVALAPLPDTPAGQPIDLAVAWTGRAVTVAIAAGRR
jgi:hypothetical protein